jgi:hypothetical protein
MVLIIYPRRRKRVKLYRLMAVVLSGGWRGRRISPTLTPKMNTRGIPGGWRGVVKKFLFERIIWPLMRRGKDC